MRQVLQNLKTGVTEVADVPCPRARHGQLLIRTSRSLISAGTERMLTEFGKAGWIGKARQQPDKLRMVLNKAGTDGLMPTWAALLNTLNRPTARGSGTGGGAMVAGIDPTVTPTGGGVVS